VVFALAMGFNFVGLFGYYIPIFYLYNGDAVAAGPLLGINGTIWAVTGLVAVFPLNIIGRRLGKTATMFIAIGLMCGAQLTKIVCYDPEHPYLVIIPTMLLSTGMLFFFTLASSMVGDICDEDDLKTGHRSEGSYYSVFWWFIKLGTAFASLVTGVLILQTQFDETQVKTVDGLSNSINGLKAKTELWAQPEGEAPALAEQRKALQESCLSIEDEMKTVEAHMIVRIEKYPDSLEHTQMLQKHTDTVIAGLKEIQNNMDQMLSTPEVLHGRVEHLFAETKPLKRQTSNTLFLLRAVEIVLPLFLSLISIFFLARYPLNEQRCYEIKDALRKRNDKLKAEEQQSSTVTSE
jgi:GPH family glycoside/pentoside/hexuronide:cation symporter